jgi:hypothetical protein
MTIKLANNVSGFLNTAITASDTGIVLQSGNGASFPSLGAGEYFYATLVSTGNTLEIVKATARSGDSLTVVRAQEGTSAAGFAAGSRFELRVTAQSVIDAINDRSEDLINNFTGNGSTTTFTLTSAPINENYTSIYINGVYQNKNTYSISGAVITFSQAPPVTSAIEFLF